jgi:hypothetical protein
MAITDWINGTLAIATVLMAAATVYLARYTQRLAKDTADGIKQAERHHQEDLRPFCVIDFDYRTDQDPFGIDWNGNHRLVEARTSGAEKPPPVGTISLRGDLRNKGKGLATDVVVYFNMRRGQGDDYVFRLTCPVVASGLVGAEQAIKIDVAITDRDIMPVWNGTAWQPTQPNVTFIPMDGDEVVLEYKDVFGNVFRTVHPRGMWQDPLADLAAIADKAKQHEMMIRQNRPTPIFLTGRQSVKTLADFPFVPQLPLELPPEDYRDN